ncbi:5'/3'-nucleotidase SurE [Candidatus Kirkpatrickella diaphorinae]|uniref:5'-nucleotidase SurE n=1 Tax=Candidatus Kirkpatrickella diaphorinae TaxID=2984322 RepID=A0ABY6GKF8_9PROT|nr:5'/3'-nucleotidase SurE [Candidatus Kirkpatrickella diaphorinae]UYH52016.1 5'/3'-nucleotidase SurE [Candidatus Kirkpatrickella diaphorinae]
MIFERILLTNDDGIDAPGLALLQKIAHALSDDVWVVAPESDRSGTASAVTLHDPLRVTERGAQKFAISGSPADCVVLAMRHLMKDARPSLVLSGINRGANIGHETLLSGTVGAAMVAHMFGSPAIALSQLFLEGEISWAAAENVASDVVRHLATEILPVSPCLNVNFPACAAKDVREMIFTNQGFGGLSDVDVVVRQDMQAREYHWISMQYRHREFASGSEGAALLQNHVTVTPLQMDRTHLSALKTLHDRVGLSPQLKV